MNKPQPECTHKDGCRWSRLGSFPETQSLDSGVWRYTGRFYQATICEVDGLCWHAEERRLAEEAEARRLLRLSSRQVA